jgi:hypothetical protein
MANDGIFAVLMAAIIDSAPLSGDEDALTIGQSVHRATGILELVEEHERARVAEWAASEQKPPIQRR